jgi:C2 domain
MVTIIKNCWRKWTTCRFHWWIRSWTVSGSSSTGRSSPWRHTTVIMLSERIFGSRSDKSSRIASETWFESPTRYITINQCCLGNKIIISFSAPYVKVYLVNGKKCIAKAKTSTARRTLDPLYQQQLAFRESFQGCVLQVTLFF